MVLLEAMATGMPAVSFDCPTGPRQIIKDGETGMLVENGNIDDLSFAMEQMIKNSNMRIKMGGCAKEDIRQRFSVGSVFAKWERLFNLIH